MIVVVAGQARDVGKTRAVCDLIAATPEAGWVAVKITPHAHCPSDSPSTDTARYVAAGAMEAHLLQGPPPVRLPDRGANLIVESNSILDQVTPDLLFFVVDPTCPEWKASALRHRGHPAAILVEGMVRPEHIALLRAKLAVVRHV